MRTSFDDDYDVVSGVNGVTPHDLARGWDAGTDRLARLRRQWSLLHHLAGGWERSGAAVKLSVGPRCGAVLMGLFDLSGCRS